MFSVLLLTALSVMSGNTFPTKVVVNGDTAIAFENSQVQRMLQAKIDLIYCEKERDSAYAVYLTGKEEVAKALQRAIDGCDSAEYLHSKSVIFFKAALNSSDEKYADMKQSYEEQNKHLVKQIWKAKLGGGIGGGLGGFLVGTLVGLIVHFTIK